jgi:hypothetical protein
MNKSIRPPRKVIYPQSPLTIDVTIDDILEAIQGDCHNCAYSRATKRGLGSVPLAGLEYEVSTGLNVTKIWQKQSNIVWKYRTPKEVRKVLKHWDETGTWLMKPGLVTMLPITPSDLATRRDKRRRHDIANPNRRGKFTEKIKISSKPSRVSTIRF